MHQDPLQTSHARDAGRVLLVDDSPDVRRLLRHYLRLTWADVTEAANGRVACDLAFDAQNRRADFDVILLDMEMPELDGHAAATLLRMQGFAGPVVALTANDDAAERARCLASGCSDYMSKPVDRDVLVAAVRRHLEAGGVRGYGLTPCSDESPQAAQRARPSDPGNSGIEPFLTQFLATLPEYVGLIQDLLRRDAVDQLAQTVHQIKGAAGMYGFDHLYDVAASAEGVAKALARAGGAAGADGGRLRDEIDGLVSLIRSTCAGLQPDIKETTV